jgi:hypothetical protein
MASDTNQIENGWQAQILRLTAFLARPLDPDVAGTLWTSAADSPPEVDENRPREGIRRQSGPFEDGQLEITASPIRIDWHMTPRVDPNNEPPAYFATFERAMEVFGSSGARWLRAASSSVPRLAVGAVLLMPVSDKVAAYRKLGGMLRAVRVDAVRSSELFYQINWPQQSGAMPAVTLNRITKWSALVLRHVSLQFGTASTVGSENHYCRLECDNSTALEHVEPFEPAQLDELFRELCELAIGNVQNGEVTD